MFSIKSKFFKIILIFTLLFSYSLLSSLENALSTHSMGLRSYKRGEYSRALDYFIRSLGYNPDYLDSLIGAGNCYLEIKVFDRAVDMFQRALKKDINSVSALNGLGIAYGSVGKFSQAIHYLNRAAEISGSSSETEYALARVYYLMGRFLWAKRQLTSILRKNPFDYRALLLMSDIKSGEGKPDEALKLILKAIEANGEKALGHVKYGDVLFNKYLIDLDYDFFREARESYLRALAINPGDFEGNIKMGLLLMSEASLKPSSEVVNRDYDKGITFFKKALKVRSSLRVSYCLGLSYELAGDLPRAFSTYMEAYKKCPSDSILRGKLEAFLVENNYKMGNPARVMLSREELEESELSGRESLHEMSLFHLRKALMLNPLNRNIREKLISLYSIGDLNRLLIGEIKKLLKLYPEGKYQDRLNLEIIKRRKRLYHREGYSATDVPRNVPGVFVLNFSPRGHGNEHFASGNIVASNVNFALRQLGRLEVRQVSEKSGFIKQAVYQDNSAFELAEKLRREQGGEKVDFILWGSLYENDNFISVNYKLLDVKRGFVIYQASASSRGRNSLADISVKIARDIYDKIPYEGRILKVDSKGILVNLGLLDGIKKNSQLIIYRDIKSGKNNEIYRHGELLKVIEADTYLSYAVPEQRGLLEILDSTFPVFPLNQRRARLVDE